MRLRLFSLIGIFLVFVGLAGCETAGEIKKMPAPQDFIQALAEAQGEISALRDTTAFILQAKGENCQMNPVTDLCAAADEIRKRTKEYRDQIDLMKTAYAGVGNVADCRIVWNNQTLPCSGQSDQILAGLIELRKLLPKGTTQ